MAAMNENRTIPYQYNHMPIGGGGYVTGFFFHPTEKDVFYCRTDIGGMYRFDYEKQVWVSLIDHVSMDDLRETCPISAALDRENPGKLYIASGAWKRDAKGLLTVSHDKGETFVKHELPVFAHGNLHGRGAGERLWYDEKEKKLWLASQLDGLWFSRDEGVSWHRAENFPETACTFVSVFEKGMLVGTEGLQHQKNQHRGNSLYASMDGGESFFPVEQPAYETVEGSKMHGLVAQRCSKDDEYVYVSFSANGAHSQNVERGYTCDCGDCSSGRIARYRITADGVTAMEEITPEQGNFGYSAVDAKHDLLITATIGRRGGDKVFLSKDRGNTWKCILHGLDVGKMDFRLSYMKPCYNGGNNLIHWLTDVKMDPHRKGVAWFNTGTGVFRTENLTGDTVIWQDWCDGMEETVHINVHAPAGGRVQVLDMIGDLGGFAFTDVNKHCDNSFADDEGNRYITCLSCDWPDCDPDHIVVTARGNWTGKTKGGVIVTKDGAKTWKRLPMPLGLSDELDSLLTRIAGVNINAGWVAVSADGQSYVWAVAERIFLHARNVIVTHDQGKTFVRSRVLKKDGTEAEGMIKPIADRVDATLVYGFGDKGEVYVSRDSGHTFHEKTAPAGFAGINFGLVDCADRTEIRAAGGDRGVLYVATGEGLWKMIYDDKNEDFVSKRLIAPENKAFCVGLGLGIPGFDYFKEQKMVYFNGIINGVYGFYRTPDDGRTIERINTERQMYGSIHSIDGDKRTYGRFFLATGSSGLVYGEEANE